MNPDCKNICIGGGYGLNVINNGKLLRKFPDYNFWFEPTCNDAGNSIGSVKYVYLQNGGDINKIRGMKNYFLGISYDIGDIKVNRDEVEILDGDNIKNIAELLHNGEIVAIYQGRSEAGPRALGHRSFLFNATLHNGKDIMNKVKKREWFRPFACMVLEEKIEDYFETYGYNVSPYMMVAFKIKNEKIRDKIPAVVHKDGTTRVQTIGKNDGIIRNIIEEYEKKSGIAVIGNTSFNLSGEPLVETIQEAYATLLKADFNYLYIADKDILLKKKGETK